MPDSVGYRSKFATIIPSTNTVVEHDFNLMRPAGITVHAGRMYVENPRLDSDTAFESVLAEIRSSIETAVRDVLTCEPDYMIMGISVETFWDGVQGNTAFEERIRGISGGIGVTTGASACREALHAYGAKRLAILSPYQPVADTNVARFFGEAGFDVVGFTGMRCPTATSIAAVPEARCRDELMKLDSPDVDAIVQVGTNLSIVKLADAAERILGKPVIAINSATFWHALRSNGFTDRVDGVGCLLRDH